MRAELLALTVLDFESHAHLEKAAALAVATGMRLRLAYCGEGRHTPFSPVARLQHRARQLGRQFCEVVEVVEQEIPSLEVLRVHMARSALVCMTPFLSGFATTWSSRDWLATALRLRSRPILMMQRGTPVDYRKVLVSASLGPNSQVLARWAMALAATTGARIDILHAADFPAIRTQTRNERWITVLEQVLQESQVDARRQIAELTQGLGGAPHDVEQVLMHGQVRDCVIARQRRAEHGLVVVGTTPRHRLWTTCREPLGMSLVDVLRADVLIVPQSRR